jgi:YihY family inner membrane protein
VVATKTQSRARSAGRSQVTKARRQASRASGRLGRLFDTLADRLPGPISSGIQKLRGEDILLFSSGLAFYALISIVPLSIFVLWVASLVAGDQRIHQLARTVEQVSPKTLDLSTFVERVGRLGTTLGLPSLITALWPASAYGAGLRRAFDRLSPKEPKEPRGLKGRGLILVVLLPLLAVGGLVGAFLGSSILGTGTASRVLGVALALVFAFVFTAVAVALIYRIFPPDRMEPRAILRGTIWSSATIAVASFLVILFVNTSKSLEDHFATGGIALIVVAAVWLFISNALLLAGYKLALDRD